MGTTNPVATQNLASNLGLEQLASESRLSLPTPARVTAAGASAFAVGIGLGLAHGGKTTELRFRAEHAHKMPTTTAGWYLYHKSKNYKVAHGAIKEGLRMGAKLGFWTTLTFGLESTVDRYRGTSDLVSTVLASLTVAGGFSLWSKFCNSGFHC
jgi:hypothetical protein